MKKYDLNNLKEFGRIAFSLGYAEYGYKNLSEEEQSRVTTGWDLEFKRNKVRMLKRYENKPIPNSLAGYGPPCIDLRKVNRKEFKRKAAEYGYR